MKDAPEEQDMIKSAPPATTALRGKREMLLSIVVPCYNEEAVLWEVHRRLVAVLEQIENTILS
jgi:hypothetical protein